MSYLTIDNAKVGLKVRCVLKANPYYNNIGIITQFEKLNCVGIKFNENYHSIGFYIEFNGMPVFEIAEEEIINPDQKCFGCGLSSPHVKPNKNNEFICLSCQVMTELS